MRAKKEMWMQVQINSDNNISMHGRLSDSIGAYINNLLQRFDPYLTRVEVHLTGENIKKSGPQDKRCVLEARAKRHQHRDYTHSRTEQRLPHATDPCLPIPVAHPRAIMAGGAFNLPRRQNSASDRRGKCARNGTPRGAVEEACRRCGR